MRIIRFVALAALCAVLAAAKPTVDPTTLTVSGISAGGAFAVQYQVAHSTKVRAAGVIAGTPYYCAQNGITGAFECMDEPLTINVASLDGLMNISASAGLIDPLSNIPKQAVMLFSGTGDTVVNHGTMLLLAEQYKALGVTNMVTYFNYSAEHAWITNYYGSSCSTLGSPYINNCGLDFAGEFLKYAFSTMAVPFKSTRGTFNPSNLLTFSQTHFGADSMTNSLDTTGYYYVPSRCNVASTGFAKCHVHVNFHGCSQGASGIGTTYVVHTGLNEWAETNDVIVVYPQAATNMLVDNPNGCFNWWGYCSDSHYADKQGAQMSIFDAIVTTLVTTGTLPSA
jgi:poly(3-hydroxybutyrate) depolymerase